jgi:hypothetical protein
VTLDARPGACACKLKIIYQYWSHKKGAFMNFRFVKLGVFIFSLIFVGALFQNCSSGGGGSGGTGGTTSSISGKAVAGAPIIGTVTVKDSATPPNTKIQQIEADGSYTVDVSGMTAPFMFRADGTVGGRSYSIYSAGTQADVNGTINVTPLTDLIIANVAGQLASTYFNSGNFSGLTQTQIDTQSAALQARLLPILGAVGVSSSIDLLRSSFSTDHTGLDLALDIIRVDVNTGTGVATITNLINSQTITDDVTTTTDTTTIDATGVATGLTDIQAIMQRFTDFENLFATSVPSPTAPALVAMFDSSFEQSGEDLNRFLTEITSDSSMIGLKFANVSIVPGTYIADTSVSVSFVPIQGGVPQDNITFNLVKTAGVWKMAGNGRDHDIQVASFARLQDVFIDSVLQTNYIDTGLRFGIKDPLGTANYAIVSGQGLPAHTPGTSPGPGGVLYFSDIGNESFTAASGTTYAASSTATLTNYGHDQIPLDDTTIGGISDGQIYTIELFSDGGSVADSSDDTRVAVYTQALTKKPYLKSDLSVSSFAPITSPSKSVLWNLGAAGGTQNFTWTIPTGLKSNEINYFRNGTGSSGGSDNIEANLAGTATSANVSVTAPSGGFTLQASGINLFMKDSFGRELVTIYNGAP